MSFLEKFKKNIGIEEEPSIKTSEDKEKKEEKKKIKRKKKIKIEEPEKIEKEIEEEAGDEIKEEKSASAKAPSSVEASKGKSADKGKWFEKKGELAVDVFQTDSSLIIQSAVAGIKPEDLDILIENDILVIEGNRQQPQEEGEKNYYYQECYWGPFHRRIILQEEVDNSRVEATMKEGILTIKIPKLEQKKKRKITVKEE